MSRLIFLGAGSAFTGTGKRLHEIKNFQSNMLFLGEKKNLLIDCGEDVKFSLGNLGLTHHAIDAVYISHGHGDHAGGLQWLGFITYFDPTYKPATTGKPKGHPTLIVSSKIKRQLWQSLSWGMGSIQGVSDAKLETYFNVCSVRKNGRFLFDGIEFLLVQTIHITNGPNIVNSYGLFFEVNEVKVFITTDTQFAPSQINYFYELADIIFHDCEDAPYKSGAHAHYSELKTLPPDIKAKMWLYHYPDCANSKPTKDGFRGFVKCGQVFDFDLAATLERVFVSSEKAGSRERLIECE